MRRGMAEINIGPFLKQVSMKNIQIFQSLIIIYLSTTIRLTSGSAMAEGPSDALVSRNYETTKYPYHMALFA